MNFYKIDNQCFPVQGRDYCFHYSKLHQYDHPVLEPFQHINSKLVYYTGYVDGNPWNQLANDPTIDDIREARPGKVEQPIFDNRTLLRTRVFDRNAVEREISNIVCWDCHGAYIRNTNSLEVVEMIYQLDPDDIDVGDRERIDLMNNPSKFLDKMPDDHELVMVLAQTLEDYYVRRVDNNYLLMEVNNPMYAP